MQAQPARPGYLELKAGVHKKLLNRLNLEALASSDRARAESEIRTLLGELLLVGAGFQLQVARTRRLRLHSGRR